MALNTTAAQRGWLHDGDNNRFDLYYQGTRSLSVDACGAVTAPLGVTVTACGLTVTAGGATVTAGDVTVTAGDLILTGGDIRSAACGDLQLLNAAGTGPFLASSCAAPGCAPDGTLWSWDGSCGAVAPCGSGFLMIACSCT